MAHDLEFRVLGPLQVFRAGAPVTLPRSGVLRGLLGMLLLADGEPLPAGRLAEAVSGRPGAPVTKGAVQVRVSRLRAWLHGVGADAKVLVDHHREGYRLVTPPDAVDLGRFRALVGAAVEATAASERFELLGQALSLRRGPVLADLTTVDITDPLLREANQVVYTGTLALGAAALAVGRAEEALAHVEAAAAAAPFDEPVHACLIELCAALERPAEALRHYERLRRGLADELGVAPSEAVQRAYLAVLAQDRQLDASSPVAVTREAPAQLPLAAAGFTGRAPELARLDALLDGNPGPAVVISAVSGTAGVGKTALAVQWAHQRRERFPDGQLYINLRGYYAERPVTPADALARFLAALGVPGSDTPLDLDERAARFRSATAGRRMLIVLDNASSVEQVRPLLPGHPACAVLVTSRDDLAGLVAVDGAHRLDLDLLTRREAIALLRRLIGPRVEAEPEAAEALARRCSRLPLALRVAAELAVARPGAALVDLVADLADPRHRLDRLDAGGDPRAAVRVVFSWSVRHLPVDAARVFALLGPHPGPDIDRFAAGALAGIDPDRAGHTLDRLAHAHLVHPTGPGRWGMHDLLRAYAADLAGTEHADETRPALDRLFDHYLATASAAMQELYPAEAHHRPRIPRPATPVPDFAGPQAARGWLDTERPNLVAVAAHTAAHGWPAHATRLSAILFRYLAGGHFTDALAIHGHAREAARQAGDPAGEAHAALGLGSMMWHLGRHDEAVDHLVQALALFRRAGDETGQARALGNLATVDRIVGRYGPASDHYREALDLYRRGGDDTGEANTLTNFGTVEHQLGRYEEALEHHRQALALARRIGNHTVEATALTNLGDTELCLGRHEEAATHNDEALALFRRLGNRPGEASALSSLGAVYTRLGRRDEAMEYHRRALALFRANGEREREAFAHNGLGEAADPTDAVGYHTEALAIAADVGAADEQARAQAGLGRAHAGLGDPARARHHYERALALYTALESPVADQIRGHLATLDHS